MRPVVEPQETNPRPGERVYKHPAFAQIVANRVQGQTTLYGSDFIHHNFVAIEISVSDLHRDLSRDWHLSGRTLIRVAVSESHWATFVSAMNIGGGVPCTLQRLQGEMIPDIPERTQDSAFKNEIRGSVANSVAKLKALKSRIQDMVGGLPKAKQAVLIADIDRAIQDIEQNLPFVADSFDEHVEHKLENAKHELHGYMTDTFMRAGIAAAQPIEFAAAKQLPAPDQPGSETPAEVEASQRVTTKILAELLFGDDPEHKLGDVIRLPDRYIAVVFKPRSEWDRPTQDSWNGLPIEWRFAEPPSNKDA
jgi:hypothetical protein